MITEIRNNYYTYGSAGSKGRRESEAVSENSDNELTDKNQEYLETLRKKFPELKLETGDFISVRNDHKISCKINPALLEKMRNDPEKEKEVMELLGGVVKSRKLVSAIHKATNRECTFCHDYIDENGKYHHSAQIVSKDPLNDKLRKKARQEQEKRIKDSIEKTREKRKADREKLSEKAKENKTDDTKQDGLYISEKVNALYESRTVKTKNGFREPQDNDLLELSRIAENEKGAGGTSDKIGSLLNIRA